jgi:hypothetical protein
MLGDEEKRRARNCHGEYGTAFGVAWDTEIDQCPKSYLTEDVMQIIGWFNDWRRFGSFPYPGDALDQPMHVYEALTICVEATDEAEADLIARRRAESESDV